MNLSEIRIDAKALHANVAALRGLASPGTKLCAVVKGNAYGHGLAQAVTALDQSVDCFQVDDLQELRELRSCTSKRALVLGYVARDQIAEALALGCELGVFGLDHLRQVEAAARETGCQALLHLKIDALLGRLGILPSELSEVLGELAKSSQLRLTGVYAHFANIEDTTDLVHADAQSELLREVESMMLERGFNFEGHISATSGLMTMESRQSRALVRLGIGVYGMYPSAPLSRVQSFLALEPALTWVSHLAQVKTLPAKHPIGYGLSYITSKPTRIGIVPQGYSDGYDRGLSNTGEVLVNGKRCPVLGRVAMNMFAIDLSAAPEAKTEDEVVLLGRQGQEQITAEEIAALLGTINYEVTSRISPLLPAL